MGMRFYYTGNNSKKSKSLIVSSWKDLIISYRIQTEQACETTGRVTGIRDKPISSWDSKIANAVPTVKGEKKKDLTITS